MLTSEDHLAKSSEAWSTGQTSFSTTVPGVLRGGHYHRRKVERFLVLSGSTYFLRKMFTDEVFHFDVNGEEPIAIDMPNYVDSQY